MSTINTLPQVSIIICNYNDKNHLQSCISSILKSEYSSFEIILVDDGSIDGSIDFVRNKFEKEPRLIVICNETNMGPAYARNVGSRKASGKYLAFLDSDASVDPLWLVEVVKLMENDPSIGAVQCKLLLPGNENRFDYIGDYLSPLGILIQRVDMGQIDDGSFDKIEEIFAVKSAGMIIRRDIFFDIGMFDEDYFIYVEETDLCWRIWLSNHKVIFVPTSKVYHDFNISLKHRPNRPDYLEKYYGPKNYITTLIKNLGTRNLIKILPINLSIWIGISVWYVLKRRLNWAFSIIKGVTYNLTQFNQIWKKRQRVQCLIRKVPDYQLMPRIMKTKSLRYFLDKVLRP